MTKAFQLVLDQLRDLRDPVQPSMQAFPPLEIDQLTRELKLVERAEDAARRERPASDAIDPDSTELDILAEIERRARKGAEDYRSQLVLYEARIHRALVSGDQRVLIEAAGQNVLADYKAQTRDDIDQLHNDRTEVAGRASELRDFQRAHGLRRPPRIVGRRERLSLRLLLGIFIVVESIMNGMFFAMGSEAGLIGGISQALVLSLLNVGGAALFAAYGLPFLRHRYVSARLVGALATYAYITWTLLLNLTIAHFRDLFIHNEGQVAMNALTGRLISAPFDLMDAQSWLLGLMGIGLSIASLVDAARMNDPYPGYGELGQRQTEGIQAFVDHQSRCLEGLQDLRDAAVEDMTAVIEAIRSEEYELRLAIEGRERLHQNYLAYLDHLAQAYERLVRRYREANAKVRQTQEPAYHRSSPIRPSFLDSTALPPLTEIATDSRDVVVNRMEHYIDQVNRAFQEALAEYTSVVDLMRETTARGAT